MPLFIELTGAAALIASIYLLAGRGGFWRMRESPVPAASPQSRAPKRVAVVIPARNEAPMIGRAIASLLAQEYAGPLHLFVVDDHSTDDTVAAAGIDDRLTVVRARPLPAGWTGKLWAISEGLDRAAALNPDYILLTDADIVHAPDSVAGLIARAEAEGLDLVSYMVRLQCRTLAERMLIPAFVFFFFMLYPPAWIANRRRRTAGAAGGCILIRPAALARIGGIASIRGEIIDDCALARAVKPGGGVWLGLTAGTHSIREYASFFETRGMISRTAFTQLQHSALLLVAVILAMALIFVAPPVLTLGGHPAAGLPAWILMSAAFVPALRFYGRSVGWAPLLPLIAVFYMLATVESAIQYWSGRGGYWKGRQVARVPDE